MKAHPDLLPEEHAALSRSLALFLADRIEEGRAALGPLRSEVLEWVYTGGLRLGVEAQALARRRGAPAASATSTNTAQQPSS